MQMKHLSNMPAKRPQICTSQNLDKTTTHGILIPPVYENMQNISCYSMTLLLQTDQNIQRAIKQVQMGHSYDLQGILQVQFM